MNIRIPTIQYDSLCLILNTIYKQKHNKKIKLNKKTLDTIIKLSNNNLSTAITLLQLKKNNKTEYKQYIQRYKKQYDSLYKLVLTPVCIQNIQKFREYIYEYYVLHDNNLIKEFTQYLLHLPKHEQHYTTIIELASQIDHRMLTSTTMICYEYFLLSINKLLTI